MKIPSSVSSESMVEAQEDVVVAKLVSEHLERGSDDRQLDLEALGFDVAFVRIQPPWQPSGFPQPATPAADRHWDLYVHRRP